MENVYHVVPAEDILEHEEEGMMCPCNPKIDQYEDNYVVIHNAFDFREQELDRSN